MKKLSLFLLLSAFFCLNIAVASAHASAHTEARRICNRLLISSDILKCLAVIQTTGYFQSSAVEQCGTLLISTDIISCLKAISNKDYTHAEVASCGQIFMSSDKIECLSMSGSYHGDHPVPGCSALRQKAHEKAQQALDYLKVGEYGKVEHLLKDLKNLH